MDERAGVFYSLYMLLDSERNAKYCVLLSLRLMFYFYRLLRGSHGPIVTERIWRYTHRYSGIFYVKFFWNLWYIFLRETCFLAKISRENELHIEKTVIVRLLKKIIKVFFFNFNIEPDMCI